MKFGKHNGKTVPAAIFAAFFTIGLIETFLPYLDSQINSSFSNEYYLRFVTFIGFLFISSLTVLFSLIKAGNKRPANLMTALFMLLPGLLIMLVHVEPLNLVLLNAFFLFSGSLFVQVVGLSFAVLPDETAVSVKRIALLYLVKSSGLIAGFGIPAIFSSARQQESHIMVYLAFFSLLISLVLALMVRWPARTESSPGLNYLNTLSHLIRDKFVLLMLGGLLVYSGAEYCLLNLIPFYFSEIFGIKIMQTLFPGVGLFIASFFTGRIAGAVILRQVKPELVFLFSSILGILGLFALFIGQKYLSLAAVVVCGLGISNIFPVMISLALRRIGGSKQALSGMMIATIPLGALFPSLMWAAANSVSIMMSFMLPAFCLFIVTWIAIMLLRNGSS